MTDGTKGLVRAIASKALAEALVTGIDQCEEEARPLDQLQRIHLATMSIMSYKTIIDALDDIDHVQDLIKKAGLNENL